MGKRQKNKKHKGAVPQVDAESIGLRLATALAEKRDRTAWSLARQLLDATTNRTACAGPCCAALELRSRRLVAEGNCRDAATMVEAFLKANPDFAPHLSPSFRLFMELKSGKPGTLARYGSDREADARLDAPLAAEIRDPRELFSSSGLAADHPLAVQARLVWQAWQAVEEDSPAAESALAGLGAIPRHSPLAPWRLFVQALAAFYAGDDERCQANLQRLPETSGAHPCARLVADLLAGRPSAAPGSETVVAAVYRDNLVNQAITALAAENQDKPNYLERAAAVIRRAFAQHRPGLALDLLVLAADPYPLESRQRHQLEKCLPTQRHEAERQAGLLLIRAQQYDDCLAEGNAIGYALAHGKWSPLEVAVARRRQALAQVEAIQHDDPEAVEDMQLYFRQSAEALPLRSTFAAWLEHVQQGGLDAREAARSWIKVFPDDERPLLVMLDDARRRRDPRGMAAMFEALAKLARGHEAFENQRSFTAAELAVTLADSGRETQAAEWLARLPAGDGWNALARLSAAYLTATRKEKREIGTQLGQLGVPLAVWLACQCLRGEDLQTTALPASVRDGLDQPDQICASLRLMAKLPDPLWRRTAYTEFFREAPRRRLEQGHFSDPQVADLLAALFDLNPGGVNGLSSFVFLLTHRRLPPRPPKATAFTGQMLLFRLWAVTLWMKNHDLLRVTPKAADEMAEILRAAESMLGNAPEHTARLNRLAAIAAIGDYRQRCQPMNEKAAMQILRREGGRKSLLDYQYAWFERERFGFPAPRGDSRRQQANAILEMLEEMYDSPKRKAVLESMLSELTDAMDDDFDDELDDELDEAWLDDLDEDDEDDEDEDEDCPALPAPRRRPPRPVVDNPRQPTFGFLNDSDE